MVRFYLLFSSAGLVVVALTYGLAPASALPAIAEIHVEGTDQSHVFRAIMGLYLGMIALWISGAFRSNFTRAAVIAEIFFMLGLACGRGLSIIVDGLPSMFFIASAVAELGMGVWGIGVLRSLLSRPTSNVFPDP
jgi:uncharacterized membrane protein YesL